MKKDKIVKSLCAFFITLGLCSCSGSDLANATTDIFGVYDYEDEYYEDYYDEYYEEYYEENDEEYYEDDHGEYYEHDLESNIQDLAEDVYTLLDYIKPLVSEEEYKKLKSTLNIENNK